MNMLSGKTEYPPTLVNLQDDVSILRQHFIPTHAFENAVILRGTFLPLRTTYGNKRGALLMWKKKDVSQMTSDQHEVTRGLQNELQNSHFTTVLDVR